MERICEPELMDDLAQARAYASADFSSTDQAMVERIVELFGTELGERIVDLGCGPGNISFRLARRCPGSRVLGIDGAAAMLAIAQQRLQADAKAGRTLRFHQARLPCPELAGGFTAVVSNSLLHHLHDPQVLWQTVRQLAAAGAAIYVKDLRRPADQAGMEALVTLHAADAPPLLRRDYRHSLQAAFSREEVEAQLQEAGLEELTVRELADRHLEIAGRLS